MNNDLCAVMVDGIVRKSISRRKKGSNLCRVAYMRTVQVSRDQSMPR